MIFAIESKTRYLQKKTLKRLVKFLENICTHCHNAIHTIFTYPFANRNINKIGIGIK